MKSDQVLCCESVKCVDFDQNIDCPEGFIVDFLGLALQC
jgi:hypothetical protein